MQHDLIAALRRLNGAVAALRESGPDSLAARSAAKDAALLTAELGTDLLVGHGGDGRPMLAFTV